MGGGAPYVSSIYEVSLRDRGIHNVVVGRHIASSLLARPMGSTCGAV